MRETIRIGLDEADQVVPLEQAYRIMETAWDEGKLVEETIFVRSEPPMNVKCTSKRRTPRCVPL